MDDRFTTSHEGDLAYAEMHRVKYQGSVMTYVDTKIGRNEKANMSGRAWRTFLVNGLPHELRKDLAKLRAGKQKQDNALLCYTSGIATHEGTGKATAVALLRSLPHNGTHLYGITIEYVVSCTCYHPVHKCDA